MYLQGTRVHISGEVRSSRKSWSSLPIKWPNKFFRNIIGWRMDVYFPLCISLFPFINSNVLIMKIEGQYLPPSLSLYKRLHANMFLIISGQNTTNLSWVYLGSLCLCSALAEGLGRGPLMLTTWWYGSTFFSVNYKGISRENQSVELVDCVWASRDQFIQQL